MAGVDIKALKGRQDARDSESAKVFAQLNAVMEGFIEGITEFVTEALAAGLREVRPGKQAHPSGKVLEVTLNGFPMTFVMGEDVHPLVLDGPLTGRIFAYADNTNMPWMDVIVQEMNGVYRCAVRRNLDEKQPRLIYSGTATTSGGRGAANAIINHIYSFQSVWYETPSFDAVLNNAAANSIGFRPRA